MSIKGKFFFGLMAIAFASFMSCSNENIVTPDPEEPIIKGKVVVPDEHSITYSLISKEDYTMTEFYATYLERARQALTKSSSDYYTKLLEAIIKYLSGTSSASSKASVTSLFDEDYHVAQLRYTTVDVNNKLIQASELVIWRDDVTITDVLYANHGTRIGTFDAPSDGFTPEVFFVKNGSLLIIPDYIGTGLTRDMGEPYLVAQNNGDVAVDGYLAGINYAKENIKNLKSDFSGYIVGYSQGGSVSLAALRSLQQRSSERQSMLNVKRVVCGDGPYDLTATFENYLTQEKMSLPIVLPLAINGMMKGYTEDAENIDYQSCFTTSAYSTGVPALIYTNSGSTADLMNFYSTGASASEILSEKLMGETSTECKIIMALLKLQNLCTGWSPKYQLQFVHDKGDTVVPYVNMEHAIAGLGNENVMDPIILDAGMDHSGGAIYFFQQIIKGGLYK